MISYPKTPNTTNKGLAVISICLCETTLPMLYGGPLPIIKSHSVTILFVEILHGNMDAVQVSGSKFIPRKAERDGFRIRCVDTMHPNWKVKTDTEASSAILLPKCML